MTEILFNKEKLLEKIFLTQFFEIHKKIKFPVTLLTNIPIHFLSVCKFLSENIVYPSRKILFYKKVVGRT